VYNQVVEILKSTFRNVLFLAYPSIESNVQPLSNRFQNVMVDRKREDESSYRAKGEQLSRKSQERGKLYSRKSNKYSWHRSEILQDGYSKEDINCYYTENSSGSYNQKTVIKFELVVNNFLLI